MAYRYTDKVRFRDTDAAGVAYFANILTFCHVAYEESLAASGIELKSYFVTQQVGLPLISVSMHFYQPLFWGDPYQIDLVPKQLEVDLFQITYSLYTLPHLTLSGQATTKHVCIDPTIRQRKPLPIELQGWLKQWGLPLNESGF